MTQSYAEGPFPTNPHVGAKTGRSVCSGPLTITCEYSVYEDEALDESLRKRQTEALVNVLRWLAESPDGG